MPNRTGKIILCKNIRLDKGYKNILSYNETSMLNLCQSKAVATYSDCSFIRQGENTIEVPCSYANALKCNYLAFQNPDYSNKWFFAFIDNVEYRSDGVSRIHFTIDECSTWFDYWNPKNCFVIREHTNNDAVGSNLVPENLELGEYVINGSRSDEEELKNFSYIIVVSEWYSSGPDYPKPLSTDYGGVVMAGGAYICDTPSQVAGIVNAMSVAGKADAIINVYMCPSKVINNTNTSLQYSGQDSPVSWTKSIAKPTTIDGYTPRNNKLKSYPFQYMVVTNNAGSASVLYYEYFSGNNATFKYYGVPTIGGSIVAIPTNYKGVSENMNESLMAGKYPTLSWSQDSFTNWLTQNSVNIGIGIVQDAMQIVGGGAMLFNPATAVAGASSLASAGVTIASQVSQIYQHSLVPQTIKGNTNGGDIITSMGLNTFSFYPVSITAQFARIADDYFDRFGYKTNKIKLPNQIGRPNWNYVQIGESEEIGYSENDNISVPATSMEVINNVYRNGVTIWHNHDNIGNYSLNNSL